jgi:hypothetical protein
MNGNYLTKNPMNDDQRPFVQSIAAGKGDSRVAAKPGHSDAGFRVA